VKSTHWLWQRLGEEADKDCITGPHMRVSYRQLREKIARWEAILTRHGIQPGECVAMYGDYSPDTCALLLALFFRSNIAVPLTASAGAQPTALYDVAHVSATVEFDRSGAWRVVRRKAMDPHPLLRQLQQQNDPGLILFSSGSTGKSKAALLNFAKLAQQFHKPRPGYRTLLFLLLDHIGGINTLFHIVSHGGTIVTTEARSPDRVCQAIAQYRVQLLPTTPTFLNMLLISEAYKTHDLSSLELITYGTEPMPATTLQHLRGVFPQIRFKQTYGLSEVGILPTKSKDSSSLLVKVGGAGYETKVADNLLWIRSDTAMLGYLNAPSPFDAEGWFNTGDVVETHGEYLRILGRHSEIINVGGEKVYPAEVESVLLEMENIRDVTVKGIPNPVTGHIVMAIVCLGQEEDPTALRRRIRRFCQGRLAPYKIPRLVQMSQDALYSERFKKVRVSVEVPPSS
jgi:acyl-CoA synthetase (AMP-forming)/AMP-acid ligase II